MTKPAITIATPTFFLFLLTALTAVSLSAQMHQRFPTGYTMPSLATQSASIGTTNVLASVPAGLYHVCWVQQITRAATTSSSLLTTIGWNDGSSRTTSLFSLSGGALQLTADVSNLLNSSGGNCVMVLSAANQPITYATTYLSVGGTTMQYGLYITIERWQ